jgi:hypothetical protein
MFGGVHDVEESEEGIDSEFFNGLFAWNIERNRFFPLTLRRPRGGSKRQVQHQPDRIGKRGRGQQDEDELLRNLAALETGKSLTEAGSIELSKVIDEGLEKEKPQKTVLWEMPLARFNVHLAVQDDVLYMFGGTVEAEDSEITFNEMWAIDLGRLDGVKEIFCREQENWEGSEDEDSEGDDDEDEDEDVEMADEEDEDADMIDVDDKKGNKPTFKDSPRKARRKVQEAMQEIEMDDSTMKTPPLNPDDEMDAGESSLNDDLPHPRPFESLRDFYTRTSAQWQDLLIDNLRSKGIAVEKKSVKELRKEAFDLSEEKWWDCREEIRQLEDEVEEAGIGEVVSLESRGDGAVSGAGRRR